MNIQEEAAGKNAKVENVGVKRKTATSYGDVAAFHCTGTLYNQYTLSHIFRCHHTLHSCH